MNTAILLLAHGSRIAEANDAARIIAARVKEITQYDIVEVAFREQHLPNIQQGVDNCVAQGARRILLVPYFLYLGAHVQEDLPEELEEAKQRHPGIEMTLGRHLGPHPKLAEIVVERIAESLTDTGWH
ncbi:sirohydrochlorin chelatase [Geomesophilobacter sediminis]|uniref:CbiX/SirB N-terminal domain-containing protein n=1 Tax=Geomesophilobacter sediminis TaxID=2798584 RepID=A0A8J7J3Y3_9BACT|nr:CbiX/SirB N-terminal domain-containing protein [Geomesophilobacter sediminis]MBJ6725428.1 CbiX/SirB N-terminal domain-containing protein [Geomesophilobacter sediminis]